MFSFSYAKWWMENVCLKLPIIGMFGYGFTERSGEMFLLLFFYQVPDGGFSAFHFFGERGQGLGV
jgi:hypothetical protein